MENLSMIKKVLIMLAAILFYALKVAGAVDTIKGQDPKVLPAQGANIMVPVIQVIQNSPQPEAPPATPVEVIPVQTETPQQDSGDGRITTTAGDQQLTEQQNQFEQFTAQNKPKQDASQNDWKDYFNKLMEFINKIQDPTTKAWAWKSLLSTLNDLVKNGADISKETINSVLKNTAAYLGSDEFKKLDLNKGSVKQTVTDLLSTMMKTLGTLVDKCADKLDKATLMQAIGAVEKFLGTNGYEMGGVFAKLDKAQKETLMKSFVDMAKKIMNSPSKTIDGDVRAHIAANLSRMLVAQLREMNRNSDYSVDLKQIAKDVVDILNKFVKSDAFKELGALQQKTVIGNIATLAVELFWKPELNADYKQYAGKFAEMFKTALEVGRNDVKAYTINSLSNVFRILNWRNQEVAKGLLKDSLNVSGGLQKVIDSFLKEVTNKDLDPNIRGQIAIALSNLLLHSDNIKNYANFTMDKETLTKITEKITGFLKGLNDGSIKADASIRNGLLHIAGSALNRIISQGQHNTAENKAFLTAFLTMAHDSLLLTKENGGSNGLQTTVINVLSSLMKTAENKKDSGLTDKVKGILLDPAFDVAKYIKETKAQIASLVGIKADTGAWYNLGLTNLANLQLTKGDKNSAGFKAVITSLKDTLQVVKDWITANNNLKDMRVMSWQSALFQALFDLTKNIYKSDSAFTAAQKKEFESSLKAIFGKIQGLQDPKVKKQAVAGAKALVKYLTESGQKDLIKRLGLDTYRV